MQKIPLLLFIYLACLNLSLNGATSISSGSIKSSVDGKSINLNTNRIFSYENFFYYNEGIFGTLITPNLIVGSIGTNSLLSLLSSSSLTNPSFNLDSKVFAFDPKSISNYLPYKSQNNFGLMFKDRIDYHKLRFDYSLCYQIENEVVQYGAITSVELNRLYNLQPTKKLAKGRGGYALSASLGINQFYNKQEATAMEALKDDSWYFSRPTTLANKISSFLLECKGEYKDCSLTVGANITTNGGISSGASVVSFFQHQGGAYNKERDLILYKVMGGLKVVTPYFLRKSGEGVNSYFDFFSKFEISLQNSYFFNCYYGHRIYLEPSQIALYLPTFDRFKFQFIYKDGPYAFDCGLQGDFEVNNIGELNCKIVPTFIGKFQLPTFLESQKIQLELKNSYEIRPIKKMALSKFEVGVNSVLNGLEFNVSGKCLVYTLEWRECYKIVPTATISVVVPTKRGRFTFYISIDKVKRDGNQIDPIFPLNGKSYGSYEQRS